MAKPVARESCSRAARCAPALVRIDCDTKGRDIAGNGKRPPRTAPLIGDHTLDKATRNGAHRNNKASLQSLERSVPHFRAKSHNGETASPTRKVDGGVRRFVRTRLHNQIPVNREVFRVFRVSRGSLALHAAPES